MTTLPTFDDVLAAAVRIQPYVHRTPVLTSKTLDAMTGARLFLKCENLQKIGAFKARGGCNAVFSLSDGEAARGVATHSSGNHAQAIAYAAGLRGIPATIVMPGNKPGKFAGPGAYKIFSGTQVCQRCQSEYPLSGIPRSQRTDPLPASQRKNNSGIRNYGGRPPAKWPGPEVHQWQGSTFFSRLVVGWS